MTFLNTTILLGLIAGAIPIIIHLITRQKAKTVLFSTLRFLKELKNQQIRRLKIRQILLLILRTLIILLLVLAFARPTLKGRLSTGVSSAAKTTAVLIVDNSLSMGVESNGQQLYDIAKQRAQELEELFTAGDEIFGLFAAVGAPPIFEGTKYDFKTVSKIIQKTTVSQSSTDLVGALVKAKEILGQSSNINKEIYLISDLQQAGFKNVENLILPLFQDQEIKVFVIPIHENQMSNLVITDVKPANQIIEKGKVIELEATVKNAGNKTERNKLVQVFIDDKRSGQATLNIEAGNSQTTKFRVVPQKTGLTTGSVLLEDDDLFLDNRRYFTFYVPEQINVLIIGQNPKDIRFLELALNPYSEQASPIKIDNLPPSRIEFGTLKNYQVVILSNVPRVDGTLLSSIEDHVKAGGGLIVFLGNEVDLRDYNQNLNEKLLLPLFTETIGEIGSRSSFLTLGKIDFSHPIFAGVFEDQKKEVESPLFYFVTKMKLKPEHEKIIEFSNGDPFLLESNAGKGKVALFASAIDPSWSDLYIKGLFVPLLNRSVTYLAGNVNKFNQNYFVHQELTTDVAGVDNFANFQVEKPDGKLTRVVPQIGEGAYKIKFQDSDIAGIYSLYAEDRLITRWAVNPDPDESDITAIDANKMKEIIGEGKIISIQKGEALASVVTTSRYGRELWKFLIGIALLFLIIEMILARETANGKREK
jgi:hypothetical protein